MQNKFLILIFASAFITGCSTLNQQHKKSAICGGSKMAVNISEEDRVSAEILKEVFNNNASAFQKNVSAFCVGILDDRSLKDPSTGILSIFSDHKPKVLPTSVCTSKDGGIFTKTGDRAINFHISNLKKKPDGSYEAQAGYYEGNLSSQTNTYNATKTSGKWVVRLISMGPVS